MLNKMIIETTFCAVDFETTGGNFSNDKIIEIGAVKIKNLKIVDKFHHIINPLRKIPYRITNITGITNDMIQGALTLCDVKIPFLNFIKDTIWIEHSINWFDFNFFINSFDFKGKILRINTFEITKRFLMLKKCDLSSTAMKLAIDLSQYSRDKHSALDDASITAEIFIKLYSILEKKNIITCQDMRKEEVLHEYKS